MLCRYTVQLAVLASPTRLSAKRKPVVKEFQTGENKDPRFWGRVKVNCELLYCSCSERTPTLLSILFKLAGV